MLADTILDRAEQMQKRLKRHALGVKLISLDADMTDFIEKTRHVCGTAHGPQMGNLPGRS